MIHDEQSETQPSGVDLNGIYYVLFRHKWKIIAFCIAGVLASVAVYFINPPVYQSEAKLLVRYVLDRESKWASQTPSASPSDGQIHSPDSRGDNIINSELEILRSFDLANQVADVVGPGKILGKTGKGTNQTQAAGIIRMNLITEAPKNSSIIRVVFQHPEASLVQPVLRELIDAYLKKHVEIHRAVGAFDEVFTRKTDELRNRLAQTEDELRKLKEEAGVIFLEDTRKTYVEQISKIREDLFSAEAELAERKAAQQELQKFGPAKQTNETATLTKPSPAKTDEYKNISAQLESFRKRETDLLVQFTPESPLVQSIHTRITDLEQKKKKLDEEDPRLAKSEEHTSGSAAASVDPSVQASRISALAARIAVFKEQLEVIRAEAAKGYQAEEKISQLQRQKELQETNYRYFQANLEQAHSDESITAGKVSNINVVQEPSPPARFSSKTFKPMAIALVLGVFGGLGLAFFIEFVLDRSVRRPTDVKRVLRLPLFLTIPRVLRNGHARVPLIDARRNPAGQGEAESETIPLVGLDGSVNNPAVSAVAPWNAHHELRAYYESLRDRLITHFEVNGMTRKPKLIAVTSCSRGAGVTSTAAGLAATLSETGDGNVLLVDMNLEQGAAHPFHLGRPVCGLSDALETEKRDPALIQEKLYMASMNDANKLPRVLPRRFTNLVPKLKMSDYDYVIFDMPAITQTSITPKLAAFMDLVLLLIESEKTNRDVVEQANSLLAESKVSAKAVLNKYRPYVPRSLQQEL
jgi:polysaccharide biosynthesis transport protein